MSDGDLLIFKESDLSKRVALLINSTVKLYQVEEKICSC